MTYRDAQDEIATLRQELADANAEVERLRDAIRHVDDLYQQGNTLGFIADAARLGRLLDERPGGAG